MWRRTLPTTPADIRAKPLPSGASPGPGGSASYPPGTPGASAAAAIYSLPPPTDRAPPNAQQFRVQGFNLLQAAAALEVTLGTFTIPAGNVGIIRLVEFDVNGLLLTSLLDFRIRINDAIPIGWAWRPFPTAAAFFAKEFPPETVWINVDEGATVNVTGQVTDAGTYDLGADLLGWFYPLRVAEAYEAAYRAAGGN